MALPSTSSAAAPPARPRVADDSAPITVVAPRRSARQQLVEVWRYRELLLGLVRKELKVKYKNSALGFMWSMLNPAMYLVVFYVAFQLVLGSGIPFFAIWLLSGLLVWNLFSTSMGGATGVVTGNASLVNKVWFPRTILPLSVVGANLVHFALQGLVLLGALALFRYDVPWGYIWLVVPALVVLVIFTSAVCIFLSAMNVYARDTQHIVELLVLAWFWMTPIVYAFDLPAQKLAGEGLPTWLMLINPITPIVIAFQRGLHGGGPGLLPMAEGQLWYLRNLGIVGAVSLVLLWGALTFFGRVEGNFAEEL
jgi:ABC-2 type transport system permease protein